MKRWGLFLVSALALGLLPNFNTLERSQAGDAALPQSPVEDHFRRGRLEASLGEAILFSPIWAAQDRPTLNYELTEIQLGCMLTRAHGSHFWRGNAEGVLSVFGGGIFEGRGNYVAGATAWLRYNLLPRTGRFVPFVQAGAGVTDTDLDRRIEGQDFNFNLDLGAGARFFIRRNWSVNLEYRYQHVSNDNLSPHNLGVNAHGPALSLSCFF